MSFTETFFFVWFLFGAFFGLKVALCSRHCCSLLGGVVDTATAFVFWPLYWYRHSRCTSYV
ncbi:MAG: hypothetical protein GTO54_11650 [Nitrososphaeria archaeon]|nr:hypothetical protein [Nitrososphaeria archaeon]